MHALAVMHRQTLYENVDSAKINVLFNDIDILRVASILCNVICCIDEPLNPSKANTLNDQVLYFNRSKFKAPRIMIISSL